MSKIAELLKLAEQRKDNQPKLEIVPPSNKVVSDGVSKGMNEEVSVSKSKYSAQKVTRNESDEVWVSKGKYDEVSVSKTGRQKTNPIDKEADATVNKTVETSPSKNFTKVSNSITKRAIPERYFRGLSKHTYDVLYQRTRGAINPTRTIQLTKDELVKLTGLSKETVKLHIKYLKETRLLNSRPAIGNHAGWEYEIFVPEEIEETGQVGVSIGKSSQGKWGQNLPLHTVQNLPLLTHTNPLDNKGVSHVSNTSLKTLKNDDDAFADFFGKFQVASEQMTGRKLVKRDAENLSKLADLLLLELKIAARLTDKISSLPAFLTEVLRRKLREPPPPAKQPKIKADTVGKSVSETYEIKPLDQKGREAALEQLREFAGDAFLEDFKKWYTEEDWNWMTEKLGDEQGSKQTRENL